MLPIAWTKTYRKGRIFTTTMGSAQDLLNEAFRRLLVNACYWAAGIESRINPRSDVHLVGPYEPLPFGFGGYKKGMKISEM
jgi:type 1 glutamine amidotransferase